MIEREDQQVLAAFLFNALPISVSGGVVAGYVGPTVAVRIDAFEKTHNISEWIVDQVLRLPKPDKFIALVRAVDNSDAALQSLAALADDLQQGRKEWIPLVIAATLDWALIADPLTIRDGRPFIDRSGFRALLPRRGAEDSPFCLLVAGDTGGGKSYLHDFCDAFAIARPGFRLGHAKVGGNSPSQLEARIVARELSLGLGVPQATIPPQHEEPERDAENLAAWIARYTPEAPMPAVAILDEFGRAELAKSVHKFIAQLALRLQDDEKARARLRLVLMGYDAARLQTAGVQFKLHVLEPVERGDVSTWFRMRYPNHPDYRYDTAADVVHKSASQSPLSQRMLVLNQEVRAAALEFI